MKGVEVDAQRPGMLPDRFRKGLQFPQGEIGFAHLQPVLGAAYGNGVAQGQTGVGNLVETKIELPGWRRWHMAPTGNERDDGAEEVFGFHIRRRGVGVGEARRFN